jgi:hypothetical protein
MRRLHKFQVARNCIKSPLRLVMVAVLAIASLLVLPNSFTVSGQGNNQRPKKEKKVESYKGEAVKLHVRHLSSTNKAIARAMKDFEKRGLVPSWENSFTLMSVSDGTTGQAAQQQHLQRVSYAPDTFTSGDYQMTFITYSETSTQWQGIIYINNPYEDDTYSAVINTASSGWDVPYEAYYPPDGGNPTCGGAPCDPNLTRRVEPKQGARSQTGLVKASYSRAAVSAVPRGFWGRIKAWARCVNDTCWWARHGGGIFSTISGCAAAVFNC